MDALTDTQWALLGPSLPPQKQRRCKRADDRATLSGILSVLRTGCRWKGLQRQYGAPTTCWERLRAWEADGTWERV
jgi:transposase